MVKAEQGRRQAADWMGSGAVRQHGALSGVLGQLPPAIVLWVPLGERFDEACTLAGLPKEISPSIFSSSVNGREIMHNKPLLC